MQNEIRAEYSRRQEARRAERERYLRIDRSLGNWRLTVFGASLLLAWLAFGRGLFSGWWLLIPLLLFVVLAVRHDRVIRHHRRLARAIAFYESGIQRLDDRWTGRGVSGARFLDASHPYAVDLDLFGRGSLFELLCTARTRGGEECLADWLLHPADPDTIRARQDAVTDLRSRLDLREEIALLGEEVRSAIDPEALGAWGAAPILLASPRERLTTILLAAGVVVTLAGWPLGLGPLPATILVAVSQAYARVLRRRVQQVVHAVDKPARDLELLSALLARLEREPFEAPRLRELRAALDGGETPPSVRIERLQTLMGYLNMRHASLFSIIAGLLLWSTLCAFAIEGWRAKNGPHLHDWLRVISEFEALSSLSGYAYEHPEDPFPEIQDTGVCFLAEGIAHPLLPAATAIRNDIAIGAGVRLYIVSGSNMSGKSTLLRTIGTNAVLALAGAPVRARRLRLTPFHLGASIRTQDSLQAGVSRFYAEIMRLRQIVDLADSPSGLLFLLDEILQGTNSHDRRIGAEAVARLLVSRGAIGLITTHDLALARIAEDPALAAANVHFQDHLEDGKMRFDYHLRPGVVEKSNAIALMRAVGLEV